MYKSHNHRTNTNKSVMDRWDYNMNRRVLLSLSLIRLSGSLIVMITYTVDRKECNTKESQEVIIYLYWNNVFMKSTESIEIMKY